MYCLQVSSKLLSESLQMPFPKDEWFNNNNCQNSELNHQFAQPYDSANQFMLFNQSPWEQMNLVDKFGLSSCPTDRCSNALDDLVSKIVDDDHHSVLNGYTHCDDCQSQSSSQSFSFDG